MIDLQDIIGLTIVGFRYGLAPENSWNYAENKPENGVSMASCGYYPETLRTKVEFGDRKRYYYIGIISDTGSDDEFLMKNLKKISYKQYLFHKKNMIEESNLLVDYLCDLKLWCIGNGWNICQTIEEVNDFRNKYKR